MGSANRPTKTNLRRFLNAWIASNATLRFLWPVKLAVSATLIMAPGSDGRLGCVSAPADPQYLGLPDQRQIVLMIDHRFALDSALSYKSRLTSKTS